jgi:16S rRNA (adenine(1408)-N(1))-methyltransferase
LSFFTLTRKTINQEEIMEIIRGKHASFIDSAQLTKIMAGADSVHIDIGTGDGRFVRHIAGANPSCCAIGIDACRENLHELSRRVSPNALFVIANAQALPPELHGLASTISINFPWGSLLEGLLSNDSALMVGLALIAQPNATLEVRLNSGALAECGWSFEAGVERVREVLMSSGFNLRPSITLTAGDLRSCPTTWAKRLAYGRDPRAMFLHGTHTLLAETQSVFDALYI